MNKIYKIHSPNRKHIRDFNKFDSNTHGSYCPYCGYLLFYDLNKLGSMYYCDCKEWKRISGLKVEDAGCKSNKCKNG